MTANELADLLETTEWTNNKAAAMLRQQQERIIKLETALQGWEIGFERMGYERLVKDKDETISQQQAEIELLEAKRLTAYNIGYEDGKKEQQK
jgi:hypothetical protein